jgi:environmental stress-induced protein Ves
VSVRILRAADRAAMPWKNGGGITHEIAVGPPKADLSHFDWRVSMATIERGGPFSTFPGVDRSLSVLEGALVLTIEGERLVQLDAASAPLAFPGDVSAIAGTPERPVRDLNVMTRRGAVDTEVTRLRRLDHHAAMAADTTLVISRAPDLGLRVARSVYELGMDDAALITDLGGAPIDISQIAEAFIIDFRRL